MITIKDFWEEAPLNVIDKNKLDVEVTWDEFVKSTNGLKVSSILSKSPDFENADYIFQEYQVILELKEIVTDFSNSPTFESKFNNLLEQLIQKEPEWRPLLLGGDGSYPTWFNSEFIRIFRPPISRILKKANKQIRETKKHFDINIPTGILVFVNDGFTSILPMLIQAIASDLLLHSYSSIDCFIYLTINKYIEIPGCEEPKLLWSPVYSDRAEDTLSDFVNTLGREWFDFLSYKIGGFTSRTESQEINLIRDARYIKIPN